MYLLCLVDWENDLPDSGNYKEITKKMMGNIIPIDNWTSKSITLEDKKNELDEAELGYYHSRLIFKFKLKKQFTDISEIREFRERIQKEIIKYYNEKLNDILFEDRKNLKPPHLFCYPIFELDRKSDFWKSNGKRPFSLQTTCFYTELDDSSSLMQSIQGRVRVRISGPKIITTPMSDWFFNNLVNLVFHEALYPLSRDENIPNDKVHYGLGKRLESFASKLLRDFHSYSSDYSKRNLQKIALILSVFGGILGLVSFAFGVIGFLREFGLI